LLSIGQFSFYRFTIICGTRYHNTRYHQQHKEVTIFHETIIRLLTQFRGIDEKEKT